MNAFVLAAPKSGGGKTTLTLALLKALSESGTVRAFKAGPDYIDPMYHAEVLDSPSYNLDIVLCGKESVRNCFYKNAGPINVVEGVMGMYDGQHHGYGSSAHLAQVLGIPVVFVLDGRALATSAAAIVKGFSEFELFGEKTPIAGVILNRIKSETYALLKDEIEAFTDIPVLGYFPEDETLSLPSRHLGLVKPEEISAFSAVVSRAAEYASAHIDLDALLRRTVINPPVFRERKIDNAFSGLTVAVARDSTFNFYYQENLDILNALGLRCIPFSPLVDTALPESELLYLGGGYPELYLKELAENTALREDIREKLEKGLYCYAECGGMLYLSETIRYGDSAYPGVGYLKNSVEMTKGLQNFGYCEIDALGESVPAHEFHHTRLIRREDLPQPYTVTRRGERRSSGQIKGNTVAGYPHLHFGSASGRALLVKFLEKLKRGEPLES